METGLATHNTLLVLTNTASGENNQDLIFFLYIGHMPTILGELSYPTSANVA